MTSTTKKQTEKGMRSSEKYEEKLRGKCEVGFEDIEMVLSTKKKGDRMILQGVKGKARPGRMVSLQLLLP